MYKFRYSAFFLIFKLLYLNFRFVETVFRSFVDDFNDIEKEAPAHHAAFRATQYALSCNGISERFS